MKPEDEYYSHDENNLPAADETVPVLDAGSSIQPPEFIPPVNQEPVLNHPTAASQDEYLKAAGIIAGVGAIVLLVGTLGLLRPLLTFGAQILGILAFVLAWRSKEFSRLSSVILSLSTTLTILAGFALCSYLHTAITGLISSYRQPVYYYSEEFWPQDNPWSFYEEYGEYTWDDDQNSFQFFD